MEMTGDAGFGFLRDNPFIKNDAAHRRVTNFRQIRGHSPRNLQEKPSFATVTLKSVQLNRPESTSPMPPSNNSKQQSERKNDASNLREISRSADPQSHKANKQQKMKNDLPLPQNSNLLKAAKKADREERASNGPNSEVEYGPGIVEKLRAKFTKLSGLALKTARVSSQVTCKRCPSVDDILSDKETHENNRERPYDTLDRNWGEVEKPTLQEQEPYRIPLMKGNSVDPAGEARKRYIVHRQVLRSEEQDEKLPSISSLRLRFEESAGRTNWENRMNYQTPATLPVIRSQSAERSYSPSLMSPVSIPHSTLTSPCPEPTIDERRLHRITSPPMIITNSPNITSSRGIISPEPQKSYQPRDAHVLREKPITQRPRSMDVASEKAVLGKSFYPPRLRLSQPQNDQLWVLEVLNRAQPGSTQRAVSEDRSGRTMVRSATTEGIHERLLSPTLMPSTRRPAPVIPEVSSGARVISSHTVHPPSISAVQPPTTLHLSHTLHRPTSDYRVETTKVEYREENPKQTTMGMEKKSSSRSRKEEKEKSREIFISPPDPDSARDDRPAMFSPSATTIVPAADASPPPEEPKPPVFTNRSRSLPPTYNGPKILPTSNSNDISGKEEMQRLLSRFNATRDKKLFEEPNQDLSTHEHTHPNTIAGGPPFGHTIHTTIQTYDQPSHSHQQVDPLMKVIPVQKTTMIPTQPVKTSAVKQPVKVHPAPPKPRSSNPSSKPPQLSHHHQQLPLSHYQITPDNVTKISVRTESPLPRSQDGASKATEPSPTRRPAPPPPPPPSQSVQEKRIEPSITDSQSSMQTRKSLSAQFLEQQARQQIDLLPPLPPPITTLPPALLSPKPYGDDATVRTPQPAPRMIHSRELSESEDEGTEVSENGDIQEENQESGERRGRASTSDSAVSVNSSQSDYSVEEEEPYGRKTGKYTFFKEVKEEKEEKIEVITRKVIEREFDVDSLEEKEEEVEEIPDEEAIKKHLEKEKEEAIVEMPIKLQMPDLSDDSEDEEVPPLTLLHSFPNQSIALMAGDGNPVRNSLISLVMEEDIPLLLEAMSENPKFEFVDLMEASTSSILHPPEKRKQRRTERQVSRISFVTGTPDVFTYLDERSAERENNWIDGTPVSYDVYQSICNEEQQEQVRQLEELERWKQNIQERQNRVEMDPDDNEMARGVTSHLSYQTGIPESARISV